MMGLRELFKKLNAPHLLPDFLVPGSSKSSRRTYKRKTAPSHTKDAGTAAASEEAPGSMILRTPRPKRNRPSLGSIAEMFPVNLGPELDHRFAKGLTQQSPFMATSSSPFMTSSSSLPISSSCPSDQDYDASGASDPEDTDSYLPGTASEKDSDDDAPGHPDSDPSDHFDSDPSEHLNPDLSEHLDSDPSEYLDSDPSEFISTASIGAAIDKKEELITQTDPPTLPSLPAHQATTSSPKDQGSPLPKNIPSPSSPSTEPDPRAVRDSRLPQPEVPDHPLPRENFLSAFVNFEQAATSMKREYESMKTALHAAALENDHLRLNHEATAQLLKRQLDVAIAQKEATNQALIKSQLLLIQKESSFQDDVNTLKASHSSDIQLLRTAHDQAILSLKKEMASDTLQHRSDLYRFTRAGAFLKGVIDDLREAPRDPRAPLSLISNETEIEALMAYYDNQVQEMGRVTAEASRQVAPGDAGTSTTSED